jgi:hypothetical protein
MGQRNLIVSIKDRVAFISLADKHWIGYEKFDIHSSEPLLSMGTPVTFGFIDDGNGVIEVEDVEGATS